jgi:hypothetical protein
MSKIPPTVPPAPPAPSFWLPFATIGLFGVLVGATLTYLALRPQLQPPAAGGAVSTATINPYPTPHLPAADLTAGQSPAEADHTLGNFYYDHQNWSEAIRHYESAIKQNVDDADIRTDLGNAYRFAGRPEDALAQYTRAQKINPAHEFSLFNQGGLYLEDLKQPAKAIEIWQDYLNRFPEGRNVEVARQLIAQARTGVTGLVLPPSTAPGKSSSSEDLILRQIQAGQTKAPKP